MSEPKEGAQATLNRVETTDPISGRHVRDLHDHPFVVESGAGQQVTIYFESDDTKQQYPDISVQHPIEHRLNLDNPTDVMIGGG